MGSFVHLTSMYMSVWISCI